MKTLSLLFVALTCGINLVNAQWQKTSCTVSQDSYLGVSGTTIMQTTSGNSTVSLSTDSGANWNVKGTVSLATGYVVGGNGNAMFWSAWGDFANPTLYRSTDNGANWTVATGLPVNAPVVALAYYGNMISAGTADGYYYSSDTGATWTVNNRGLSSFSVTAFLQDENGFEDVLAIQHHGAFLNGPNGWESMDDRTKNRTITALCTGGSMFDFYIGTADSGVFHFGQIGTPAVNNGLTDLHITAMAFSGTTLFAATASAGIFATQDQGLNWTPINAGFTSFNPVSLVISGTNIYAGFAGNGGVWKRPLADIVTGIKETDNDIHLTIYPNPASDKLALYSSSVHTNGEVTVSTISLTGEVVSAEKLTWSNNAANVDIKNLSAGIYFLQLKWDGGNVVKKFVKE